MKELPKELEEGLDKVAEDILETVRQAEKQIISKFVGRCWGEDVSLEDHSIRFKEEFEVSLFRYAGETVVVWSKDESKRLRIKQFSVTVSEDCNTLAIDVPSEMEGFDDE